MQSDFVVYAHNLVERCEAKGGKYASENTGSQSNFGLVSVLKILVQIFGLLKVNYSVTTLAGDKEIQDTKMLQG